MFYQYRGVAYAVPTNTLPTVTTKVIGKYRGVEVATSVVIDVPRQPLIHTLTYRGVRYGAVQVVTPVALTPALT
ncbi:DUF4278 domain-containing protein [Trichothermofontia sp.]